MVWSPAFSRAFVSLSVFTMSFPWLMLMLSFFMIIQFFDSQLHGALIRTTYMRKRGIDT